MQSVPLPAIATGFGVLALGAPVALGVLGQSFTRRSDGRAVIAFRNDQTVDCHGVAQAIQHLIDQATLIKFGAPRSQGSPTGPGSNMQHASLSSISSGV